MAKKQRVRVLSLAGGFLLMALFSNAQLTLVGQLRPRTEVRNGYGNLVLKGSKSAAFISQRTRLTFGYKWDRLTFGASIQDVRVWGQDASTISNADGSRLMLHEGWADLTLFNKTDTTIKAKGIDLMSIKIGRQELSYDDVRLIGNLDWLQQGRRHDMALLKTVHKGWQVDIGYAFNQNSDAFGITNTSYVPFQCSTLRNKFIGCISSYPGGTSSNGAIGQCSKQQYKNRYTSLDKPSNN
jgi:hypothetical protein